MRLFMSYDKVQKWHREHSRHHIEYYIKHKKADWLGMLIDYECSRHTKAAAQLNGYETVVEECKRHPEISNDILRNMAPLIEKIRLIYQIQESCVKWNDEHKGCGYIHVPYVPIDTIDPKYDNYCGAEIPAFGTKLDFPFHTIIDTDVKKLKRKSKKTLIFLMLNL